MATETFSYTGGVQTWTANKPQTITIRMDGAGGGDGGDSASYVGGADGQGGNLSVDVDVAEGEVLDIYVAGAGANGPHYDGANSGGAGGWGYNNGGDGAPPDSGGAGGGGGGATGVVNGAGSLIGTAAGGGGGGGAGTTTGSWGGGGGGGARGGVGGSGANTSGDGGGTGQGGDGGDGGRDSEDGFSGSDGSYVQNLGTLNSGGSFGNYGDGTVEIEYSTTPQTPSSLSVDATTDTTADLSLTDDSDNEDGFYVYRATASGSTVGDYTQVADIATPDSAGTGSTVTYTDTGLLNGERYFYRATAYNADGESQLSNEATGTTTLPAMTDLSVDAITGDQFDLSARDNANNKDGYRAMLSRDSGSTYSQDGSDLAPKYGLNFDGNGSGDGLQIPHDSGLNPTSFTVAFVVQPNGTSSSASFPKWAQKGANGQWQLHTSDTDETHVKFNASVGGSLHSVTGSLDTTTEARLVAARFRDADQLDLWLETQGIVGNATYSGSIDTTTNDLFIANNGGTAGVDSQYDGFWYYNRALSDSELQGMAAGDIPTNGLLVSLEMNDGSGSTVVDSSGNNRDASFIGSPEWIAPLRPIRYTTSNLLDGEQYTIAMDVFTEHTTTRDA